MTAITHAPRGPLRRRLAVVSAAVAAGLLLAACGGQDGKEGAEHGSAHSSATTRSTNGAFNGADVHFAQMMIPHHQQALEMARLAPGRASDAQVKQLAARIEKAQDPEIRTMSSWLKSWGKPQPTPADGMPGMDHGSGDGHDMDGMMSQKEMDRLKAAKGVTFDRDFARLMIEHHKGAIAMAKDEQKDGRNAAAKKLAGDIITGQSAEVTTLHTILDRL
ncbi:DUF305 domain-containing protein [Streptomyces coffeae]|uniref:DUF305 domain-containing protein n=1 Tax=Streptomyces coffeae TaxID=621382 RepID=A0ABS1N662_9ACTN|nr:DUF305 domain-containing protein [Streptomyces coffeae]MBL1095567.1 DUF305 domain-containing protein [Streptomyces coffeae]